MLHAQLAGIGALGITENEDALRNVGFYDINGNRLNVTPELLPTENQTPTGRYFDSAGNVYLPVTAVARVDEQSAQVAVVPPFVQAQAAADGVNAPIMLATPEQFAIVPQSVAAGPTLVAPRPSAPLQPAPAPVQTLPPSVAEVTQSPAPAPTSAPAQAPAPAPAPFATYAPIQTGGGFVPTVVLPNSLAFSSEGTSTQFAPAAQETAQGSNGEKIALAALAALALIFGN